MTCNVDKEKIKKLSIASGILLFLFLLMFLFLILSRNSWQKGLSKSVERFFSRRYSDTYVVESGKRINSGFSTSAYGFTVTEKKSRKAYTAVVLNITTLYGPYPAVFLCGNDDYVKFLGFIGFPEDFEGMVTPVSMKSVIYYWEKRIPSILTGRGVSDDK